MLLEPNPLPWTQGETEAGAESKTTGPQPGLEPRRRASLEGLLTSVGATLLPNSPSLTLVLTHDWT